MAEAAGLVLSIATLLDTCLTTYKLIVKIKDFPIEVEFLRVTILCEEKKLHGWTKLWGIKPGVSDPLIRHANHEMLIREAETAFLDLELIEQILKSAESLLNRGKEIILLHQPSASQTSSRSAKLFSPLRSAKSRLQWSAADSETFRSVVNDLEKQNNRLLSVQPRLNSVSKNVQQMAATSGAIESLDNLDLKTQPQVKHQHPEIAQIFDMRDQFKRAETSQFGTSRSQNLQVLLPKQQVWYDGRSTSANRTLGTLQRVKDGPTCEVLIEWKYYAGSVSSDEDLALSRTDRVAELLSTTGKPEAFRILDCVGWFHESELQRCGIMFSMPSVLNTNTTLTSQRKIRVVSLTDLMRNNTRPTLQERFRLALFLSSSMLEFHLANWWHKNFTSDSVFFFVDSVADGVECLKKVDITSPYIGLFGLARPNRMFEPSEAVVGSAAASKAYQHPSYLVRPQRDKVESDEAIRVPRYERAFDVYSLGCVLLEVGFWKPLSHIGWREEYQNDLDRWRRLLMDTTRTKFPFYVGPSYADIVLKCLSTESESGSKCAEGNSKVTYSLEDFCWDIVCKIDQLRV